MTEEEIMRTNSKTIFKFTKSMSGLILVNLKANIVCDLQGSPLNADVAGGSHNSKSFLFYFGNFHNKEDFKDQQGCSKYLHDGGNTAEGLYNNQNYKKYFMLWIECDIVKLYSNQIFLFEDD
ncbi:MAG: hypothetical protein WC755_08510 [Candidatus Woesearchaeota archaeon]|jgi:hypothetical protein